AADLADVLTAAGATVLRDGPCLTVTGLDAGRVGDLACRHALPLYELVARQASLEDAFMELTADSAEFRAGKPFPRAGGPSVRTGVPSARPGEPRSRTGEPRSRTDEPSARTGEPRSRTGEAVSRTGESR
ncbi:hypothetical protein AB0I84_43665, partial [Streptomyces spectabilis]